MNLILTQSFAVLASFARVTQSSWTVAAAPQSARLAATASAKVAFSSGRAQTVVTDTIRVRRGLDHAAESQRWDDGLTDVGPIY